MDRDDVPGAALVPAAVPAAAGIAATMLLAGPGGPALAITAALVGVQVALLLIVRRGALRARRFLLAWSAEAGLTYAVAGDPTVVSALVYLGVGLVFAVLVVVGLELTRPAGGPPEPVRDDTRPLPVAEGD